MVKVIIIKTTGDLSTAVTTLNRIKKKLPKMTRLGMRRWGNILVRDMKLSLRRVSVGFRGVSEGKGIRWEQGKRSDTGYLFMRQEYLALDHMRPHWVSVKRSRTILLRWAKQAIIPNIKRRARMVEKGTLKSFGVYVKPHPFIANGYGRARPKLRPVLKRVAARGINV